jgi:16S rRNA (cytidine1402-2'-O)-methyltransferase
MKPGILHVVATPIGNLEDITHRAVRVLSEADVVAAEDTRATGALLRHFGIRAPKLISFFEGNEAVRAGELVAELEAGRDVALVSEAGTPGISDPGERLVRAAVAAGVRVEVVPGPVAAIAALVGSGLPAARFLFLGFPPRVAGARRELFGSLRHETATMLFYEAPDRVGATLADLAAALGDERRVVLGRELTKRFEEQVRGCAGELAERYREAPPRGECTLVVEGAAAGASPEIDLEAALRDLLRAGLGPKDAAARLVVATGKPRRQLYQLALSLRRELDGGER